MPLQPKIDLLLQINEEALKVTGRELRLGVHALREREEVLRLHRRLLHHQSLIRSYPTFTVTSVDRATNRFYQRNALTAPMGDGLRVHREPAARRRKPSQAAEEAVAMHKAKPAVAGPEDADPAPVEPVADDPRVGRPSHRARSRARLRGQLRRHELPHHRQARASSSSARRWSTSSATRRRTKAMATCGYDDDGVKTTQLSDHQGRHVRRLPDDARPGAPDRPEGVARLQLRRQLVVGPLPAHAERLAAAEREGRQRAGHHRARPTTASTSRATAATRSTTSATTSSSAARRSGK